MAAAKKCDICETYYDKYNTDNYEPNCLTLANEYVHNNNYLKIYDCCPDCMKSIKDYINSLKPKKDETEEEIRSCNTCAHCGCYSLDEPCRSCHFYDNWEEKKYGNSKEM